MKGLIKFLSKKVINQIAAGEVILRPSSVLRELLENAIDANAKKIDIFIKNSGKTLIQLIDDGEGMNIHDAKMSFKRYATSKINKIDDIFQIKTKGFRGEALSSIALISQLEIQTKNKKSSMGIHLFIEEGKIKKEIPLNMLKGTRISVKNIFYKIPARRQFLKSSRIEFLHIINEFYKIVLAHRDITYRFYHNNKMIFFLKKTSLKQRIEEIFKNKKKNFSPIFIKKNKIFVKGFVSIPDSSVKKGNQFILINYRSVTHIFLHNKIIHAYDGFLKELKTISYFIFIHVDSNLLNWNVHPEKKEVKLEKEDIIGTMIQQEIKNVLFHQYEVKNKELKKYNISFDSNSFKNDNFNYYHSFFNNIETFYNKKKVFQIKNLFQNISESNSIVRNHHFSNDLLYHYSVSFKKKIKMFQMNRKYIIYSLNNEDMMIIDQHRAHKNILFEFFLKKRKNLISQLLLFPIKMKLLKKEFFYLKKISKNLMDFGFHLYFFNEYVYLYSIPEKIHQNVLVDIFQNILKYNFIQGEKEKNNNKILISISKFASIKCGTKLSSDKMESLVKDLFSCEKPYYTFSGKPIFFVLKKQFFEKIFKK
ncbi:DNA mismatch repair endonuclease MutL [Blattabacterium cuenoti]|uniref:DNA mismatch repair endonuclease MutL n=1 Tax=Blattabacterium cuenoti TaxID=1653831 RepID=UPI00163BF79C|nr:DNA mismatch repair endonuclease MutL [Blattabacterium cuenoti]